MKESDTNKHCELSASLTIEDKIIRAELWRIGDAFRFEIRDGEDLITINTKKVENIGKTLRRVGLFYKELNNS